MWNDNWGDKPWQYDDKYLQSLVNKLNTNCEKQKELSRARKDNRDLQEINNLASLIKEWDPEDLDYDIHNCRKYCGYNSWYEETYELCGSCKTLLEEKIRNPFNKTPREIGQEFQILNDRIEELEKCIQIIQSKLEC
jgi:hypothetical protein